MEWFGKIDLAILIAMAAIAVIGTGAFVADWAIMRIFKAKHSFDVLRDVGKWVKSGRPGWRLVDGVWWVAPHDGKGNVIGNWRPQATENESEGE